jgi:olefin beta-lactone synthetase
MSSFDSANIARHLPLMAARQPDVAALKIPRGRTRAGDIDYLALTFAELEAEVSAWAAHLTARGVRTDDRVLVMVRQGLPLIAAAFALFKIGAVPVVIDPGMGLKSFLRCVARSRPRVLLGIPLAQLLSHLFRPSFRSIDVRIPASANPLARRARASSPQLSTLSSQLVKRTAADLAAVLFTSGSTGAPKGVRYEHGMFEAQVRLIRDTYAIQPGEIDLPMLPIFALFNPALGMTTIVPEIDPARPAAVDPAKIVQAIRQEAVTNSFGSPTLWNKIADHCLHNGTTLPSLRRVLCAGAPVPAALWEKSRQFLPNGKLHSPYGATEALPVSSISADEVDATSVRGACVGHPVSEVDVKIIALADGPLATLADARELPTGEIGEIVVRGPSVTQAYDHLPEATAASKIFDPNAQRATLPDDLRPSAELDVGGSTFDVGHSPDAASQPRAWHRMGDCGYLDARGTLWFCGRKVERVETADGPLYTEPCEQVFRLHPQVARCAVIGLGARGAQVPALVVERRKGKFDAPLDDRALSAELRALARAHPHTAGITRFYFHARFPVDVRHNAKIHRLTLATWAAKNPARELRVES